MSDETAKVDIEVDEAWAERARIVRREAAIREEQHATYLEEVRLNRERNDRYVTTYERDVNNRRQRDEVWALAVEREAAAMERIAQALETLVNEARKHAE